MAEHSVFPEIHHFMEMIPVSGLSWHDVITQHPVPMHLAWCLFFVIACGFIQIICHILAKKLAPLLMGYSRSVPLPKMSNPHHQQHYNNLRKLVQNNDIGQYSPKMISQTCCNGELSEVEVQTFLNSATNHRVRVTQNEVRFKESLFPIITKGFTLGFGVAAVYDKEWVYEGALFWKGLPYEQGLDCCSADIKLLYMMHIGWYIYKLFAHAFIDRTLKDATANLIHHFTAMTLLCLSYYMAWIRVGTVVLLLHDPADFLLQCGKFWRLIHQKLLCDVTFAFMTLTWFATRLVIFPYHVIGSCWNDFYQIIGPDHRMDIAIVCLSVLYALHLYWFSLILRILKIALSGGEVKDTRSDDDVE